LHGCEAFLDFGLLVMDRRTDRRQAGRVRARMLDDIVAERVVSRIARRRGRLGRLEPHVVPAEVLEATAALAEALGTHGRASGTLAGEETGREGSERLGFGGHLQAPLLTNDAAAEAPDRPRSCGNRAGRCPRSRE